VGYSEPIQEQMMQYPLTNNSKVPVEELPFMPQMDQSRREFLEWKKDKLIIEQPTRGDKLYFAVREFIAPDLVLTSAGLGFMILVPFIIMKSPIGPFFMTIWGSAFNKNKKE